MSDFKVKYASQININRDWAFAPGQWFKMDWGKLEAEFPEPECYLVALDSKQLNLIHQLVSVFPKFYRNWGYRPATLDAPTWDAIQTFIAELEGCLMSGCKVSDLASGLNRLTAAIAGEEITIEIDGVPTLFDYTETGISPILASIATDTAGLAALANLSTLTGIQTAISGLNLAVTVQPAAPMITIEAAVPDITVEPSPVAITVDATTDISAIVTALAPLSELDSLPDMAGNLALFPDLVAGLEGLENLQSMDASLISLGASLAAIDTDLDALTSLAAIELSLAAIDTDLDALTPLAESVEGINQKTETLVTWDELLERIGETFGFANGAYLLFSALSGLIPDIKLNPTEIIKTIIQYFTWSLPITKGIKTHNKFMAAIAASQAGQAIDGVWDSLSDLMERWRDALIGNVTYFEVFDDIWDLIFGEEAPPNPLVSKLDEIKTVLEAQGINNRDVLDAIENILGGTYEPPQE